MNDKETRTRHRREADDQRARWQAANAVSLAEFEDARSARKAADAAFRDARAKRKAFTAKWKADNAELKARQAAELAE